MKLFSFLLIVFLSVYLSCVCFGQGEIIFQTEGSTFNPLIMLKDDAHVRWTFADGDTSNALNPEKDYESEATRLNSLYVNPWSALKMINIGYDAGDGGSYDIPFVTDQQVSAIRNLNLVKDYLEIWCSSYNRLDTLIFDGFILLDTVECFLSTSVKHVSLRNTPSLTRLCLEDNDLTTLDVSECSQLMDLRGAVNNYTTICFSDNTEELWHICIRNNPQVTNDSMFSHMEKLPGITELFIWDTNQKGKFEAHNCFTNSWVTIQASDNHYSSLDFSGGIIGGAGGSWIVFSNNEIKSVNVEGFDDIYRLDLNNNGMAADTVDKILNQIDQLGIDGYPDKTICLKGNERPTSIGMAAKESLESRGWIVEVEGSEIVITGNDIVIENGDATPSIEDLTDFDRVKAGEQVVHRFVISNSSPERLHLTGNPVVSLAGADTADFRITSIPDTMIEWWGGADTLEITFSPLSTGQKNVVVSVEHDGVNTTSPFVFSILGEGFPSVGDTIVGISEIACFGSQTVLIVGGNDSNVLFLDQSTVQLIASGAIVLLPGFHAYSGSNVSAWITTTDEFCDDLKSVSSTGVVAADVVTIRDVLNSCRERNIKVFPNPSEGIFTLQASDMPDDAQVILVSSAGKVVYRSRLEGRDLKSLNLSHLEKGMYLLSVKDKYSFFTQKIIIR